MKLLHPSPVVSAIRAVLVLSVLIALARAHWSMVFVALAALFLSAVPEIVVRRLGVRLPVSFIAAITVFVFATLFLGEVLDFYEKYWWWDLTLHGSSAVGFGLLGVIFALFLFEGDRYAAPPWALSLIAFSFAITIGVIWEIFEFGMDRVFGLNMQKSGLIDTMSDLMINAAGAGAAAVIGFFYFKGQALGGTGRLFSEFAELNRRLFRKFR